MPSLDEGLDVSESFIFGYSLSVLIFHILIVYLFKTEGFNKIYSTFYSALTILQMGNLWLPLLESDMPVCCH